MHRTKAPDRLRSRSSRLGITCPSPSSLRPGNAVLAVELVVLRHVREHHHMEVAAAGDAGVLPGAAGEFKLTENVRQLGFRDGVLGKHLRAVRFGEGFV